MAIGAQPIGTRAIGTFSQISVQSSDTLELADQIVSVGYSTEALVNADSDSQLDVQILLQYTTSSTILGGGAADTVILPTDWKADDGVTGTWVPDEPIEGI